jgi:hypothetical protein
MLLVVEETYSNRNFSLANTLMYLIYNYIVREYVENNPDIFDEFSLDMRYKEIIDTLNITLFID